MDHQHLEQQVTLEAFHHLKEIQEEMDHQQMEQVEVELGEPEHQEYQVEVLVMQEDRERLIIFLEQQLLILLEELVISLQDQDLVEQLIAEMVELDLTVEDLDQ